MVPTQAGIGLESLEYVPSAGTYLAEFDQATTPPSMALVGALATVTDADPVEIDPLYGTVDTDALDELVGDPAPDTEPVSVNLSVEGCSITVSSAGTVALDPPAGEVAGEETDRGGPE